MSALRKMLREQLCSLGRIAARHQLPSDAVWEIVKAFDILYIRAASEFGEVPRTTFSGLRPPRPEPHPGITYLLDKISREAPVAGEKVGA